MKDNLVNDTISRAAVIDAVESLDWYHQNKNGEMVHGANSDEHQAWYKADDIYKAIESVPSAQPTCTENVPVDDCISRQAAIDAVQHAFDRETLLNSFVRKVAVDALKTMPPAQPGWIPCTPETMPEKEGRYVCTYTYDGKKDVFMFRFEDGDFLVPWYVETVTAWYKPLDPWEGGQE